MKTPQPCGIELIAGHKKRNRPVIDGNYWGKGGQDQGLNWNGLGFK